jgi:hypothetical protein
MLRDYRVTIGIAPTRRDKFPDPKEALKNKQRIMPKLKEMLSKIHDVKIVDIDCRSSLLRFCLDYKSDGKTGENSRRSSPGPL